MRTEFFLYEVIQTIIQKQWGRTGKATRLFRLKLGLDQKGIHFCKKRIIQIMSEWGEAKKIQRGIYHG